MEKTYTAKETLGLIVDIAMIAKGDEWIPQEDDNFKEFLDSNQLLELFLEEYCDFDL